METVLWVPMFLSIIWCLFILGCPPLLAGLSLTCFYTCWLLGKVPSQTRPGFIYLRINLKSLTVWGFHRDAQESAFPREKSNLSLSLFIAGFHLPAHSCHLIHWPFRHAWFLDALTNNSSFVLELLWVLNLESSGSFINQVFLAYATADGRWYHGIFS